MPDRKIFAGERLRRLRGQAGLNQAALAVKLGISASYLNQIERDQRPITPRILEKLTATLNVPARQFADSEDARRESQLRGVASCAGLQPLLLPGTFSGGYSYR